MTINLFEPTRSVSYDAGRFVIKFPDSDTELKATVKEIPGVKHDRAAGLYHAPANSRMAELLQRFLPTFKWSKDALLQMFKAPAREKERAEKSKSDTAELVIPNFGKTPFPFQRAGILYATEAERVIIGDEMGLGKTIQGMGSVEILNAYPCLIVTPSSNKYQWAETEIPAMVPHRRVVLASKKTPRLLLEMADIIVTNYEQLLGYKSITDPFTGKKSRTIWHDMHQTQVILSPLAQSLLERGLQSVILDEAHYIKDSGTGRTKAAMAMRKGVNYRFLLTGTPMLNKPAEFVSLLQYLDRLDEFGGWHHFMTHYCGMRKTEYGIEAKQAYHTKELNFQLRSTCYIRRQKKDVLKELPPKTRSTIPVDIDNRAEYTFAEKKLKEWVRERVLQDKKFLDSIAHHPQEVQRILIRERQDHKESCAERGKVMVEISALKQLAAEGKLKTAIQWIRDFLESGEKLVVFATHKKIIDALLKAFPDAARIISEDDAQERERNVKRFQSDPACQLIIGSMGTSATNSPAGVGHTLTAASNTLFLELGWNPALHNQCEDRCHRIGQKSNVTAHYLLGRDTIDIKIAQLIESKREMFTKVVDGEEEVTEAKIINELMEWLAA